MFWSRFGKNEEVLSITFVVFFSLTSLTWKGNLLVRGIATFQGIGDFFSGSFDSFGSVIKSSYNKIESFERVREERDSCLAVMDEYQQMVKDADRLRAENTILRQELNFSARGDYPAIRAEVLSVRLNSIYRTIIIDKGSESGIKSYMPVVSRAIDERGKFVEALVGKVIAVSKGSSVVQPLINSNFNMGVSVPGTNLWASLSGNSGRGTEVMLDYIDSGIVIDPHAFTPIGMGPSLPPSPNTYFSEGYSKIGKAVFSSSGSGVYPAGIPIGTITEEGPRNGSFKTAYVRPFVEFDKLQIVTIIKKLPDKWSEEWPAEKSVQVEGPYFGEIDFPREKEPTTQTPISIPPKPLKRVGKQNQGNEEPKNSSNPSLGVEP